jgi:hypothetical protein
MAVLQSALLIFYAIVGRLQGILLLLLIYRLSQLLLLIYSLSQKRMHFQIQISALIQTTYCISFQRVQFHMIRTMFLPIRRSKAIMNFKELQ